MQISEANFSGLALAQCHRAELNQAQIELNRTHPRGDRPEEHPPPKLPSPEVRLSEGSQAMEGTLLTNTFPLTNSERTDQAKTLATIWQKHPLPATQRLHPLILLQL